MATVNTRHLRDEVTHWPVTGTDDFGDPIFGTPVKLKARWEDKQELFRTVQGEEVVSNAIVFLSIIAPVGDYLGLGDLVAQVDPTTVSDTFKIRAFNRVTDLRRVHETRKAIL